MPSPSNRPSAADAGVKRARDALERTNDAARTLVDESGVRRLEVILRRAALALQARIDSQMQIGRGESFTAAQARVALAQVEHVLAVVVVPSARELVLTVGEEAARIAAEGTVAYVAEMDRAFRGIAQPLALDEARMYDRAAQGSKASLLRRIAGEGGPRGAGILARYGLETVKSFEDDLQLAAVAKKPWGEVRDDLVKRSPFLQGKPKFWAERIVRTEGMGAHGRAALEANQAAAEELGDVVKILSAAFDDRTGADSIAVHGQIRKPGQAFHSWNGSFDHPPDRPNDRAVLVTHRLSWPLPAHLLERPWSEVVARWHREGRKGAPPDRPLMSTIPLARFGAVARRVR